MVYVRLITWCLLYLFTLAISTPANAAIQPSEQFTNHEILDPQGNFEVFWKYDTTHVTFEIHVKTLGYVGFGISAHGQMYPADMIIGWVKDGEVHFKDRHSIGMIEPLIDESQDWILLSGKEEAGKTILKFSRPLRTCDKHDKAIEEGTVKLIYSWHPDDPQSDTGLEPHGPDRRGSKSIMLLSPTKKRPLPPNTKKFDFVNKQYHLRNQLTQYHCTSFRLPDIGGKHHMIMYEPIIEGGHDGIVHHIIVYHCPASKQYNDSLIGREYECYSHTPTELKECMKSSFLTWAVGGGPFYLPDNVGFPVGEPGDSSVFILETHYNNPKFMDDIVDSSGLRMHYTSTLRKHDGDILYTGVKVNHMQIIPPGYEKFVSTGFCSANCTKMNLKDNTDGVNIFGIFPHSHLLGRAIRSRIIRDGVETVISDDENYDFDYQESRLLNKYLKLKPGDVVKTECVYKSRDKFTYGGLSTEEEMCIAFLMYYPRVQFGRCASFPLYSVYGVDHGSRIFRDHLHTLDWTNQTIRDNFQRETDMSTHLYNCDGHGGEDTFVHTVSSPPEITTKYVKEKVKCPVRTTDSAAALNFTPSLIVSLFLFIYLYL